MSHNYNQNNPGGYNPQRGFNSPGQFNGPAIPPPRKSSNIWLILGVVGGIGFLCVAVCCGGGLFVANWGMNVVSADIERQLRDNPQMQENIGEISSLKADFVKSSAEDDMDTFVYDVKGSKGEGELTVKSVTNSDGNEDIVSAQLRMSDGRTIELVLDQGDFARPWKPVE